MRPRRPHVAERRDADEQARNDERHDDHRDESDEQRADRLDRDDRSRATAPTPRRFAMRADGDTGAKSDEESRVELHARTSRSLHRLTTAASVRSTSATRMSPMCPMRKPDGSNGPESRRGENAARLDVDRERLSARYPPAARSAVSVDANLLSRGHCGDNPSRRRRPAPRSPSPHDAVHVRRSPSS